MVLRFNLHSFFKAFVSWTFCLAISLIFLLNTSHAATNNSTKTEKNILVFGDSLSAAYGMAQSQGWVNLLQNRLHSEQYLYQVANASISGETTIGGKNRIEAQLKQHKPEVVILELGANDGLRGLPVNEMQENLTFIIQASQKSGAKVLLLGMKIPPNYGPQYTESFDKTYKKLSQAHKTALVPFMLENVIKSSAYIQDDGLHPNALAQPLLLDSVWPTLKELINK